MRQERHREAQAAIRDNFLLHLWRIDYKKLTLVALVLVVPVARLRVEVVRERILITLTAVRHALSRVNHELDVFRVALVALERERGDKVR